MDYVDTADFHTPLTGTGRSPQIQQQKSYEATCCPGRHSPWQLQHPKSHSNVTSPNRKSYFQPHNTNHRRGNLTSILSVTYLTFIATIEELILVLLYSRTTRISFWSFLSGKRTIRTSYLFPWQRIILT